jgi:hypothetical protein
LGAAPSPPCKAPTSISSEQRSNSKPFPKKYEYQDSVIDELEAQKKAIDEKLKARKKFLENLTQEVGDTTTGEVIRPANCLAAGSTIQVTF